MKNDYWVVEFNETSELVKDYSNRFVTEALISELMYLDERIKKHNNASIDVSGNITDEFVGYHKFYFEHRINGGVVNKIRIDIGDGLNVNRDNFESLKRYIKNDFESETQDYDNSPSIKM